VLGDADSLLVTLSKQFDFGAGLPKSDMPVQNASSLVGSRKERAEVLGNEAIRKHEHAFWGRQFENAKRVATLLQYFLGGAFQSEPMGGGAMRMFFGDLTRGEHRVVGCSPQDSRSLYQRCAKPFFQTW
jgi:hypothetical protein